MVSTRRLNTPTGGPSIDSNATVGPEGPGMPVSAAFVDVVSVQPPAHKARNAAAAPRHICARAARDRNPLTTLTPPRPARAVLPPRFRVPGLARRRRSAFWVAPNPRWVQRLAYQRNRVDVTAVVRLAPVSGTTVAEKARRIRVGAEPE